MSARHPSQRAEQRRLREQMRALGMSRVEIAADMARRYKLRSRPAWRAAWGWTLEEAAERYNALRARNSPEPVTALTGSRLSEWENWPLSARKPSVTGLFLLAEIYQCGVLDLVDVLDREKLPSAELLILDKTDTSGLRPRGERDDLQAGPQPLGAAPDFDTPVGSAAVTESGRFETPVGSAAVTESGRTVPVSVDLAAMGSPHRALELPQRSGAKRSGPLAPAIAPAARSAMAGAFPTYYPAGQQTAAMRFSGTDDDRGEFGLAVGANWPGALLSVPVPDRGVDWLVQFPAGRALDAGGTVAVQVHPLQTAADGSAYLPVAGGRRLEQFVASPYRGMLIGVEDGPHDGPRMFGVDLRAAHHKITHSPGVPSAVVVPRAYELDDLTYGIIWALTSLEDALLADDSALDQRQRELRGRRRLPQSADGHMAAGLSSAAQMWLGSSFCARHILANLADPPGRPVFWTREQTGEEACAWLLFRHKHSYLQQISGQFGSTPGPDPLARGFCIPEAAVAASPRWERMLLFLSVALMESLGIRVKICAEPEYASVDGFVLLPGNRAIIATWVRVDDIWHADYLTGGPAIRDFTDVTRHITAHSVTDAESPGYRLMALAAYLDLDWTWLWQRCAGLGAHGCAGLTQPRSRLLSTQAVDAALSYVGMLGRQATGK